MDKDRVTAVGVPTPPLRKKPSAISQLKQTGARFLQDGPCFKVAPKLPNCRDCITWQKQFSKEDEADNICCRFLYFRCLKYTKNGQLAIAGFGDPYHDVQDVSPFFILIKQFAFAHKPIIRPSIYIISFCLKFVFS